MKIETIQRNKTSTSFIEKIYHLKGGSNNVYTNVCMECL